MPTQACQLGIAVVEQLVPIPLQCVALLKPHMPKGIERVLLVVEISRVAVHQGVLMAENHIPAEYLRIGNPLLVKTERLGMLQIHQCLCCYACCIAQTKTCYVLPTIHGE